MCLKHDERSEWNECDNTIQGVTEISALILTGNRTHQKEQLFSLPFWLKKVGKIFLKPFISPKLSYVKNVKQPDSYEVDFLLYG
jgi:hypothetical protein